MTDVSSTPINGVAYPQLVPQHGAPDSAQPAIKRKRVDSSEDEAQVNGDAPQDVTDDVGGANILGQIADFITVLKK